MVGEDIVHTFVRFFLLFTPMALSINLTDAEISWIAGLLEGEGSFNLDARSAKRYAVSTSPPSPFLQISMTDEDVIAHLAKLLKKNYFVEKRKTVTGKSVYKLAVGNRKLLSYLYPLILPHLSTRRQKAFQESMDAIDDWQLWLKQGGRSQMAKEGPKKKKELRE